MTRPSPSVTAPLRALSLLQPYASLAALGAKQIETRSWSTKHRGEIAIHASQKFGKIENAIAASEPFLTALSAGHSGDLPLGAIVAVARLVEVEEMEISASDDGWFDSPALARRFASAPDERAFGDYAEGRYGWLLADVRLLPEPVPCKGALGLWAVPPDVEAQVRAQIGGAS